MANNLITRFLSSLRPQQDEAGAHTGHTWSSPDEPHRFEAWAGYPDSAVPSWVERERRTRELAETMTPEKAREIFDELERNREHQAECQESDWTECDTCTAEVTYSNEAEAALRVMHQQDQIDDEWLDTYEPGWEDADAEAYWGGEVDERAAEGDQDFPAAAARDLAGNDAALDRPNPGAATTESHSARLERVRAALEQLPDGMITSGQLGSVGVSEADFAAVVDADMDAEAVARDQDREASIAFVAESMRLDEAQALLAAEQDRRTHWAGCHLDAGSCPTCSVDEAESSVEADYRAHSIEAARRVAADAAHGEALREIAKGILAGDDVADRELSDDGWLDEHFPGWDADAQNWDHHDGLDDVAAEHGEAMSATDECEKATEAELALVDLKIRSIRAAAEEEQSRAERLAQWHTDDTSASEAAAEACDEW